MTPLLPLRTSVRSAGRLCRSKLVHTKRLFSSDETGASPLVLWLESSDQHPKDDATGPPPRILMPKYDDTTKKLVVSSPNDVMKAVDEHYSLTSESQQFVGGMGEADLGVWFASNNNTQDPLHHYKLIQESITQVKQYRHGVPFGVYTSGVNLSPDLPPLQEIGLARVQVSLIAANPHDYANATDLSSSEANKAFGQVCGYCVTLQESGFPLEVAILQEYASSARDLAVSLGAVDTHVYPE